MGSRKDKTKSQILAEAHKDTLILQNESLFYTAYDESACILADITHYQLIQLASGRMRCSCLADKWEMVQEMIEAANVSYIFVKKNEVIASKEFEDNKFRFYADGVHVPDSIRNQDGSRTKTENNDMQTVTIDDIKRYRNALVYTQRLCDGIDPVTGKVTNAISLENPNVMRYLFYIKDFLEKHKIE